ncbi:MAG: hypothetical protein AVDCRST_MAG71-1342, partial [uncultured Lysobacter sp.]
CTRMRSPSATPASRRTESCCGT